jgi:hypothetical protein
VAAILLREELVTSETEAKEVAMMSEGSLTTAQQLLNADLRRLQESMTEQLSRLEKIQPLVIAKKMAEELEKISSGGEEQRQNAQWLLKFMAEFLKTQLRRLADGDLSDALTIRFGVRVGVDLLAGLLDRVVAASRQIDGNSPVRLVLEALFDDFARQLRIGPVTGR